MSANAPDRRATPLVVNEIFLTRTAARAHVVFPVAAFAEKEGATLNSERRLQGFSPRAWFSAAQ